ncbi:hypothetical protein KC980_01365 [candidate division WWE3 bacterium]|uniref:Uncharacterized protein n=1 Tax=candidate division WWE3 bacterium TaxID=2053526 RepID=A0A955EB98_UNCKA|nr:hypothetical protein [candidate division WWE3 bacterium]MCB0367870.1 hypothetical protein [Bdellovibrionales bacterium]
MTDICNNGFTLKRALLSPLFIYRVCVIVSFFLTVLSFFSQVFISNTYAAKSTEMRELLAAKQALSRDIDAINLDIIKYSSIAYVNAKALDLGFERPTKEFKVLQSKSTDSNL